MVFTLEQWPALERGEYAALAAPIRPPELGRKESYMLALPPRHNFALPWRWEEVDRLPKGQPLEALRPQLTELEEALEASGALPQGALVRVSDTERLLVNLPEEFFPDRQRNLHSQTL